MEKRDTNQMIGLLLIFVLLFVWTKTMKPPEETQSVETTYESDTLSQNEVVDTLAGNTAQITTPVNTAPVSDSLQSLIDQRDYGIFGPARTGQSEIVSIENDVMRVDVDTKGGNIVSIGLKQYQQEKRLKNGKLVKSPLLMMDHEDNKFEYLIPVSNAGKGTISSKELYFVPSLASDGYSLRMTAPATDGNFTQVYHLEPGSYNLDYTLEFNNIENAIGGSDRQITLNWINYLDKVEPNAEWEASQFTTVYYKENDARTDFCSCRSDDVENISKPLDWISHTQQFFSSALIPKDGFGGGKLETVAIDPDVDSTNLKLLKSAVTIPVQSVYDMDFYIGPNDFDQLRYYDNDLEDVINFGWSFFGTINRWVIRPIFNFLSGFISSKGVVILVMTLIIKLALFPLTFRMLKSQTKMGALKPELEKLKKKYEDDAQGLQMANMKLYQEYGVSPVGGCLPMVLQMPIWFALYRFFPASIDFRQEKFLWANDLSTYDAPIMLPYEIPMIGDHISLFTLLWVVSIIIYTYYNSKMMSMSAQMNNPVFKYMQYFMPVMFFVFLNKYAAGLTAYLLFSNVFNIAQTILTKEVFLDQEKIRAELNRNKSKPKKKGGFSERLQNAMAEQRKIADKQKPKKK